MAYKSSGVGRVVGALGCAMDQAKRSTSAVESILASPVSQTAKRSLIRLPGALGASEADAVAARLITFLETGKAAPGLFSEDAFVDFTLPRWRPSTPAARRR